MDIWQWLENDIQNHTGEPFELAEKHSVSGGDVNQSYMLSGKDGSRYFVKMNARNLADMFAKEAEGLSALRKSNAITVPEVIAFGEYEQCSYLILQYISMGKRGSITEFAKHLAQLHLQSNEAFGFVHDNYIGKTPQKNQWNKDWGVFFAQNRIGYQLDILQRQGVSGPLISKGRKLMPKLAEYLNLHQPKPALVHGDLWQGNYSFDGDGNPLIFDPACYYGDHEVDLAMLELFGNPGEAFFSAYHQVNPIADGYQLRKQIYNLYHILNHANFFAGSYIQQSTWMIDELLETL